MEFPIYACVLAALTPLFPFSHLASLSLDQYQRSVLLLDVYQTIPVQVKTGNLSRLLMPVQQKAELF